MILMISIQIESGAEFSVIVELLKFILVMNFQVNRIHFPKSVYHK